MSAIAPKRIQAIDLARGISVLMVIIVHTLWIYGDIQTQSESWLGSVIHMIGKGTPMFLIAMGVSFTLSRNQSILLSIRRAFYILGVGYLMNLLKFLVPVWLDTVPDNFIQAYGWTKPVTFSNMLYMLGTGDILQLAGVSLLFMGVVNKVSKNKYVPLVIALCIILTTKVFHGFRLGIVGVDYVLDLLWGAEWNVYFAVFPWFSFILIGVFFGKWYKETNKSNNYIFLRMLIGGIVLMLIGGVLCYSDYQYHFGDYFHLGPGGAFYLAGFNLVLLWIAHIMVTRIKANAVFNFFYYCSKRVTTIYLIQWVIICWGMGIFGYQNYGVVDVLLFIPVFVILTIGIQELILEKIKFKRKRSNNEANKKIAMQNV